MHRNFRWLVRGIYRLIRNNIQRCFVKNKDVTILSPTCIAGLIYHYLGLEFESPTINLFMTEDDFFNFVTDLKWYVGHEVVFFKEDELEGFPIGLIYGREQSKNIYINFNHHKDFMAAKCDWDRRKARINYDNIFIIASTRNCNETRECVMRWNQIDCKGIICFTAKEYLDIPYAFKLNAFANRECCDSYMREGLSKYLQLHSWEKEFNYIKWLNGEKNAIMLRKK